MNGTGDPLEPWWQRRPDRLRWELTNFADYGLPARFGNGQIFSQLGLSDGRIAQLRIEFPFEYPRRHPTVQVEAGLVGPPHEVGGHLCLFDDAGSQWHPQRGAAELVHRNVRDLLEAVLVRGDRDWLAFNEEQIPEPVSRYWDVEVGHVVLVPDPLWGDPAGETNGIFILRGKEPRWMVSNATGFGKAAEGLDGRVLCTDHLELGRWVELARPPRGWQSPGDLLGAALAAQPDILTPVDKEGTLLSLEWVAITYRDEGPRRGDLRRGWQFVQLTGRDTVPPQAERMPQTQALTPRERSLRLPELDGLASAKVVLVGAGSLGSPVALELAKAGVGRLLIIDDDRYDANNAVRHVLGVSNAGSHKAIALACTCHHINPFCNAEWLTTRVGVGREAAARFLAAIDDAALVIETTGSREVTRVVERYCRIKEVPLLTASLTRASRGGDLVVLRPDRCFDCFLVAQGDGAIPSPEQGPQPLVVPVGCASPAFSGAGFDATELAALVARTAVRSIGVTEYPALDFDWAVVNFVGEPHYQAGALAPDLACGHHQL